MKVKSDRHSKFSNLSKWKEEAWKYQRFKGIRTGDLPHTSAMLHLPVLYHLCLYFPCVCVLVDLILSWRN